MGNVNRIPIPGVRETISEVHAYEAGKTIEEVRRELGLDRIVKLGSNENPFAPFPEALEAMSSALSSIHTYPESSFVELRKLIGALYQLSPEHVAIAHGAGGMLETIARMFVQPGDEVVIPATTYGLYREISRFMGATVHTTPLDEDHRIDIDAMIRAVSDRTKIVWLCNPNNPTSTVATGEIDDLLDALPETGWLVLDEAYAEFADGTVLPDWKRYLVEERRIIVVRTFSKAYGLAGARMGYAVAAPLTIRSIDTVAEPFNANRIGIAGAIATLERGMNSVADAVTRIREERKRLIDELTRIGCQTADSQTNFVFFELPTKNRPGGTGSDGDVEPTALPAKDVADQLLRRGVIVRSGTLWGFPQHIRVTVGTPEENTFFLSQLQEVLGG